ncbi:hypothetical protein F183_A03060 [Bryobacterales bacterium F-183]|nr:hypothetical protein F183_A03060 [Bryobacterales bacterium F-183]
MRKQILIASFSLAAAGAVFAADAKHPWAAFKPGSYAKYKTTSTVAGNKTVSETTQTLVSIDANNAVIETEMKAMGQVTKNKATVPLKEAGVPPASATKGKPPVMTNETVTAAGKSLACKCYDITSSQNGMTSTVHVCNSDSVPFSMVKSTTKTTGAVKMESVMELVEFAAK